MTERNAAGNPSAAGINQPTEHERKVAEATAEHRERPFGVDLGGPDAIEDDDEDDREPGPAT